VVRFLALSIVGLLIFLIVRSTLNAFVAGLRGASRSVPGRRAGTDQLVKDPVCETYIPRRKAICRGSGSATRYFCSAACADRYAARS
jgi:YHS domain-containing protein